MQKTYTPTGSEVLTNSMIQWCSFTPLHCSKHNELFVVVSVDSTSVPSSARLSNISAGLLADSTVAWCSRISLPPPPSIADIGSLLAHWLTLEVSSHDQSLVLHVSQSTWEETINNSFYNPLLLQPPNDILRGFTRTNRSRFEQATSVFHCHLRSLHLITFSYKGDRRQLTTSPSRIFPIVRQLLRGQISSCKWRRLPAAK